MVALRATVRAYWREPQLAHAVARVNDSFLASVPIDKFATFFVGRLSTGSGRVDYVNAGHNRPLLFRAGGATETLDEGGMVLGMFDSVPYADGIVQLGRGDVLLIYSDGITEAWDDAGDEYGDKRLAETAKAHCSSNVAEIHERVLAAVDAFSDHAKPTDDRTLIVLKRE